MFIKLSISKIHNYVYFASGRSTSNAFEKVFKMLAKINEIPQNPS